MMSSTPPDGVFVPVPTSFHAETKAPALQPAIDVPTQVAHIVHVAKSKSQVLS